MSHSTRDPGALTSLLAIFDARQPDGTFVYTDAEVRHYLPYLVLAAKIPIETLHESVQELVGQLVVDAKLELGAGAAKVQEALHAFYAAKPVNAALHKAVMGFAREQLLQSGDAGRAAVAALLGRETTTGVLGGGVRPPGTVPGGPLSRLAGLTKKK